MGKSEPVAPKGWGLTWIDVDLKVYLLLPMYVKPLSNGLKAPRKQKTRIGRWPLSFRREISRRLNRSFGTLLKALGHKLLLGVSPLPGL